MLENKINLYVENVGNKLVCLYTHVNVQWFNDSKFATRKITEKNLLEYIMFANHKQVNWLTNPVGLFNDKLFDFDKDTVAEASRPPHVLFHEQVNIFFVLWDNYKYYQKNEESLLLKSNPFFFNSWFIVTDFFKTNYYFISIAK